MKSERQTNRVAVWVAKRPEGKRGKGELAKPERVKATLPPSS